MICRCDCPCHLERPAAECGRKIGERILLALLKLKRTVGCAWCTSMCPAIYRARR